MRTFDSRRGEGRFRAGVMSEEVYRRFCARSLGNFIGDPGLKPAGHLAALFDWDKSSHEAFPKGHVTPMHSGLNRGTRDSNAKQRAYRNTKQQLVGHVQPNARRYRSGFKRSRPRALDSGCDCDDHNDVQGVSDGTGSVSAMAQTFNGIPAIPMVLRGEAELISNLELERLHRCRRAILALEQDETETIASFSALLAKRSSCHLKAKGAACDRKGVSAYVVALLTCPFVNTHLLPCLVNTKASLV